MQLDLEKNLRILILRRPYDSFRESEETRDLMTKIFKMKFDGYLKHYPYGIMPVGEIDFMGDHIVLCRQDDSGYTPVAGFKSIKNSTCELFKIPFPVVAHKFGHNQEKFGRYVNAINHWSEKLAAQKIDFAYNLSWTMQTDLGKEDRALARDISYAMLALYYVYEGIDNVINSTAELHSVNTYQEYMGLTYLKDIENQKLPSFPAPNFADQPFYVMHTERTGFSPKFLDDCMIRFKNLWESRLIIGDKKVEKVAA